MIWPFDPNSALDKTLPHNKFPYIGIQVEKLVEHIFLMVVSWMVMELILAVINSSHASNTVGIIIRYLPV